MIPSGRHGCDDTETWINKVKMKYKSDFLIVLLGSFAFQLTSNLQTGFQGVAKSDIFWFDVKFSDIFSYAGH